jgi:hypothetical protein
MPGIAQLFGWELRQGRFNLRLESSDLFHDGCKMEKKVVLR